MLLTASNLVIILASTSFSVSAMGEMGSGGQSARMNRGNSMTQSSNRNTGANMDQNNSN